MRIFLRTVMAGCLGIFPAIVLTCLLAGTAPVATAQLGWDWAGPSTLVDAVVAVAARGVDIRVAGGPGRLNAVHVAPGGKSADLAALLAGLPDGEYMLFVRVVDDAGLSSPWSSPLPVQVLGGRITDAVGTLRAAPDEPKGLRVK